MKELIYKEEVFGIIGAAMEVHRELGSGFLEGVYQEAMEIELESRKIPHAARMALPISYKNRALMKTYEADLVCFEKIIVELKALGRLSGREEAQVLNYLKATKLHVGLLINFGSHGRLEWQRYVL